VPNAARVLGLIDALEEERHGEEALAALPFEFDVEHGFLALL
jgi:hypothetical protein